MLSLRGVRNTGTGYWLRPRVSIISNSRPEMTTVDYVYDSNGAPVYMTLNGTTYYYQKNLQGDIIGIVDSDNVEVVTYSYDAWGKLLSISGPLASTVGEANHLRYRGYYYDTESGLYYLQSRYYDPEIGRFISKDDPIFHEDETGVAANLYAYCDNNPIMNEDPSGYFVIRRWMISAPIDILLMLIPGIGAAFAPIKSLAKSYGKIALKTKIKTPLMNFIRFIAKNAGRIITGFQKIVGKIPFVGRRLASKIPVKNFVNMIAGATSSIVVNKFLNIAIPNIDIFLSIGGAISGILDYIFDKKLNNSIWVI